MDKVEILLIDYVDLCNTDVTTPVKGISAKFKWLKMMHDYSESDMFNTTEKNKVDDLSTNLLYLNI